MECREFQVTVHSAKNVENVRHLFKNRLRVYAKVSLGGNHSTQQTTPVDNEGHANPEWNFSAAFTVGKNAVKSEDVKFLIQLYCSRNSGRDKYVGEVSVSLKELFDRFSSLPQGEDTAKVSYPVKKEDAYSQGEVNFSYKFGDVFAFVPPPTDWGKVCWQGTKLIVKGGMLCIRLTLLANRKILDLPIDAAVDIGATARDIISQVCHGGGDLLADIPFDIDTISGLQTNVTPDNNTNVSAASYVPAAGTSAGTNWPAEAPIIEEDVYYHQQQPQVYKHLTDGCKEQKQEEQHDNA